MTARGLAMEKRVWPQTPALLLISCELSAQLSQEAKVEMTQNFGEWKLREGRTFHREGLWKPWGRANLALLPAAGHGQTGAILCNTFCSVHSE